MIIPDMSEIIINKAGCRGYYVCDKTAMFYLHKDGNFKFGIKERDEPFAFWPTKEEAVAFYESWKKSNSGDLPVKESDIFKDCK